MMDNFTESSKFQVNVCAMKKKLTWYLVAFVLFQSSTVLAQIYYMDFSIQNLQQTQNNQFEFEVWLKNLNPNDTVKLSFLQFGLDLPAQIANGGTLSIVKTSWDPAFNGTPWGVSGLPQIQGQPTAPTIRVPAITGLASLAIEIPVTGNGILYGKYQVTNTIPFALNSFVQPVIIKDVIPGKTRTIVAGYVNGSNSGNAYTYYLSTPIVDTNFRLDNPTVPSLTLNPTPLICPTSATVSVTNPNCFGQTGSASLQLLPAPGMSSGTYSLNGGTPVAYTTIPFSISGLSQGTHTVTIQNDTACPPFNVYVTIGGPTAPVVTSSLVVVPPSCAPGCDGHNVLSSNNGTGPYTYSVSGPVTQTSNAQLDNLCVGNTYTVQTVDALGCSASQTYTVAAGPTFFSSNQTACNSYTWPINGQTYTQSGTYTSPYLNPQTNCTETRELILLINSGSSSSSSVFAGNSYFWPCNNQNYFQSGTYTCYSTNSVGCPDTQTLILTLCNLNVTTNNVTTCENVPVSLSGSPSGGTFSIPNPYTGPQTNFTYVYTDPNTGCTDSAYGVVNIIGPSLVSGVYVNAITATTANVIWTASSTATMYEIQYAITGSGNWINAGMVAAPQTSYLINGLQANTSYQVRVRGLCDLSSPHPWSNPYQFMTFATGLNDQKENHSFTVYPVPAQKEIVLKVAPFTEQAEVQIMDLSGRILWTETILSAEHPVHIGALANGTYFAQIQFIRGEKRIARFIKKE